jgi:hypothetical protein
MRINNFVDIGVVPHSNYSYGLYGAEGVEDKRKIAAVDEETHVFQKTSHLAQTIVKVPVTTSAFTPVHIVITPLDCSIYLQCCSVYCSG